ncbi:hypothetical protein EJ08DRAFT_485367 [Tothia fuscella]|uniref:FHA domain-containing protein n=1 Tax=Tothia fuscella TaxID=1048955 RepID=A0A9P4TTX9_9PEZI|nr:hypothetical protein EJ08DRAFT_485367 [Tothia fuscella]
MVTSIDVSFKCVSPGSHRDFSRCITVTASKPVIMERASLVFGGRPAPRPHNFVIAHPNVSREHAVLLMGDFLGAPAVYLQDTSSRFGTFKNGRNIGLARTRIAHGDQVAFALDGNANSHGKLWPLQLLPELIFIA